MKTLSDDDELENESGRPGAEGLEGEPSSDEEGGTGAVTVTPGQVAALIAIVLAGVVLGSCLVLRGERRDLEERQERRLQAEEPVRQVESR